MKLEMDITYDSSSSEIIRNEVEFLEPFTEVPIVNLIFTATVSSSSSSSSSSCSRLQSSSFRLSVPVSSSSSSLNQKAVSSSPVPSMSSSSSLAVGTTTTPSAPTTTTPLVCDGCNCPVEYALDPVENRTLFLKSPLYPQYYPNLMYCTWIITSSQGQLNLVFDKFTLQSDFTCSADYLQVSGPIKKYRRARLCGYPVRYMTIDH